MISNSDKPLIKSFVDNKPLMKAVRRVITSKIHTENFIFDLHSKLGVTMTDEEYGCKIRVQVQALIELDRAFQEMTLAVAPEEPVSTENEAR